jgi:GTP-binding protein
MADIPGIIEGASEGKGLGLRFLRHIERNALLLFMVPADSDDIRKEYEVLLNEVATYNPELLDKQRVLAITKSDMLDDELIAEMKKDLPNIPHVFISSVINMGLTELKDILWAELNSENNKPSTSITHRNLDVASLRAADDGEGWGDDDDDHFDEEEFDFDDDFEDEDFDEDELIYDESDLIIDDEADADEASEADEKK